uniref:sulfite exporter TauE/SafE family protein 3-like n=1 Tax=Erigeron canadensis TaxID=72917 RepID=UPI001CB8D228|nr:sulfite exporter TauE/SafE family protein 3-like [Erigeron canadensis]
MKTGSYKWKNIVRLTAVILTSIVLASMFASAEKSVTKENVTAVAGYGDGSETNVGYIVKLASYLFQTDGSEYHHVWPEMEFGWKIVTGTFITCCGAVFGSVGGVGGGGIFVPMLSLIMGFDPKSATATSKCLVMGVAVSTVYHNMKLRHPTLDMPMIDYDLALLLQPMLMLGVSTGVTLNVMFAEWMVTLLIIILFIGISIRSFRRGVETWRKETIVKKEAAKCLESNEGADVEYKLLPGGPSDGIIVEQEPIQSSKHEVTLLANICWKETGLLVFVWVAFLGLQIGMNYTSACSILYWVLNLSQVPISLGVSGYEVVGLYRGTRTISSKGVSVTKLGAGQLAFYVALGFLSGMIGGLLGIGGGMIIAPLFLELGIPPQVSSATAMFAMMFSSSMSAVEYYLLKRFPVSYALYLFIVAAIATLFGQKVVRKRIMRLGRVSLIIFVLAFTIFISTICLGGVGISNMIGKMERHEYMGFESLCKYQADN